MITIFFVGGGGRGKQGILRGKLLPLKYPRYRRRISGRRFSPSDFSRQVKLKPKTPDVLAGYHKG